MTDSGTFTNVYPLNASYPFLNEIFNYFVLVIHNFKEFKTELPCPRSVKT